MSTQNERSVKAQIIWNSTNSNSVTPTMVGSLFYDINVEKLERDNSNAVYQTYDASYTKMAAINPTTKKMTLIDITDFVEGNLEIKSNKSDSYTASSSTTYASTKALVDGLATKQKEVTVIPITGDITLSEIHNGAMLHITNSCIITFPSNLGKDFNFVEKAFGSIVVQHVAASGVSLNSDSGLILKNGATGSVYAPSNDNFILTGTYSTT